MSKNELRSSGERRRRGFANGAGEQYPFYVRLNHSKSDDLLRKSLLSHDLTGTSDIKLDASIHFMFAVPSAYFK